MGVRKPDSSAAGHLCFCHLTSLGLRLCPVSSSRTVLRTKVLAGVVKPLWEDGMLAPLRGAGLSCVSPRTVTTCHCSAIWRSQISFLFSVFQFNFLFHFVLG